LLYLQAEKGCSPLTAKAYRSDLCQFFVHLQENFQVQKPSEITVEMIRSWIVCMHQRTAYCAFRDYAIMATFYLRRPAPG